MAKGYRARKDLLHKELTDIIAELRNKHGILIDFTDTSMIGGFCDFVLTIGGTRNINAAKDSVNWIVGCIGTVILVEVKSKKNDKITQAEDSKLNRNRGNYALVRSMEDLISCMFIMADGQNVAEVQKMVYFYDTKILKKEYRWAGVDHNTYEDVDKPVLVVKPKKTKKKTVPVINVKTQGEVGIEVTSKEVEDKSQNNLGIFLNE